MAFERAQPPIVTAIAALVAVMLGAPSAYAATADGRRKPLTEAEQRDAKLPTLIALAECSEQAGNWVDAEAQWSAARDRAKHDEKPQSRARAEARLVVVQKRLAHLTLQLGAGATGAQVLRDDVPLEPASLGAALPMNPGEHVILVKLAGHDDARYPVKLTNGDNQTLAIAAGPLSGPPTAAATPPPAPAPALAAALPAATTTPAPPPAAPPAVGCWSTQRTPAVILGSAGIV